MLASVSRALIVAIPVLWAAAFVTSYTKVLWVLTGFALLLTVVGLRRAPIGLLGVSMLACLDAPSRVYLFTGGWLRWNTVAYLLLLAALVYFRDLRRLWGIQLGLLVAFTFLLSAELLLSPDRSSGLEHLLGLSVIFGMLGFCFHGGANPTHWAWVARVCGVLAASGGPFYFLRRDDLLYINPNAWAYLPATAVLLCAIASCVIPIRDRRGVLLPLCVAINLTWIYLSGSRGTLLVGVAATALFILQWKGGLGARLGIALAFAAGLATAGYFGDFETGMSERLRKLLQQDRSLSNRTSGRSDIALVGWQMFLDSPMGVGTGGFLIAAPRYGRISNLDMFRSHGEVQAHSAWIKTLGENGLLGVLLLAGFVASFGVVGWRLRSRGLRWLGLAVSLALAIGFLSSEFQSKGLWLFAAAGMVALKRFSGPATPAGPNRPVGLPRRRVA